MRLRLLPLLLALAGCLGTSNTDDTAEIPWRSLTFDDFVNVNGTPDTWTRTPGGIRCTGVPLGGARSTRVFQNFELEFEWRHEAHAGNSGLFLWCPEAAFTDLPPGTLPRHGIEVQILDPGYEERFLQQNERHSDWFTSHGDIFKVGEATCRATHPRRVYEAPDGSTWEVSSRDATRSFPTARITRSNGQWNHYRVLAVDGRVDLWVNGEHVNSVTHCSPARGYLALESEGTPIDFRGLRIRELPTRS